MSDEVVTSAAIPVAGSDITRVVDPPTSTINAILTPYLSISHAVASPTVMPSKPLRSSSAKSVSVAPRPLHEIAMDDGRVVPAVDIARRRVGHQRKALGRRLERGKDAPLGCRKTDEPRGGVG